MRCIGIKVLKSLGLGLEALRFGVWALEGFCWTVMGLSSG